MRMAIELAEAIGWCCLLLDEIDSGLSGSASGGRLDSGVTSRVIGTLLTWMQEKTSPVFIICTANSIDALPPAFTRKGRLDELFFCDLPTYEERREIFEIHLAKRGRDAKTLKIDVGALAQRTPDFSGAEIEATIKDAMFAAYDEGNDISQACLLEVIGSMIPLAKSRKEEIDRMRNWARACAVPASGSFATSEESKPKRIPRL